MINCTLIKSINLFILNELGDLHGQFIDLFTIFDLNNLPSKNNIYLFNGDFVDRGRQQCEVYLTLLYGLVLYGSQFNCFFLNRGNHEDYGCSVRFGFKEEVMTKYCLYSKIIMKRCAQSFALLPLYSIINQQGYKDTINKILVGEYVLSWLKISLTTLLCKSLIKYLNLFILI